MKKKLGFTLIEILVTATIIGLLAAVASISYSQLTKQSRDAKRKTDLEQVRAALEIYRSNSDTYPVGTGWATLSVLTGPIIYLQTLPSDPKSANFSYYYSGDINDYTLAAQLEVSSSCSSGAPGGSSCGSGSPCNYCLGPYGQK
jgi:general secretion pathway protein G